MKTDKELKQIAWDLLEGKIFTDRDMQNPKDLPMVFMPMVFMEPHQMEEFCKDLAMIYEYFDKAGPRACNGMPNFFSMQRLTHLEFATMKKYFDQLLENKKQFMEEKDA